MPGSITRPCHSNRMTRSPQYGLASSFGGCQLIRKASHWLLLISAAFVSCSVFGEASARQLASSVSELDEIPRVHPEYRVPDEPNQLFYVERSVNSNTVVYAAKFDAHNAISQKAPVEAFWRWYNVDGHRKDLNFIERMMAYGVHVNPPRQNHPITFTIAALPERTLTLDLDDQKRPEALIQIAGRTVKLAYVYLEVVDGVIPSVPSLDIFGIDKNSGKAIREHVVQN
jgi:hypothetical protein